MLCNWPYGVNVHWTQNHVVRCYGVLELLLKIFPGLRAITRPGRQKACDIGWFLSQ